MGNIQPLFLDVAVVASNAPVYTRRSLLVAEGPQAPSASTQLRPMQKPPLASAGIYWKGRTPLAEPPPEGARLPSGSTTIAPWQVVV